jgi:hypothetical protein
MLNHSVRSMTGKTLEAFMVPKSDVLEPGGQDLLTAKITPVDHMPILKMVPIAYVSHIDVWFLFHFYYPLWNPAV